MTGDHFLCLGKIKKKKGWLEGKSSWPLGWKAYSGSEKVMICLCISLEHRLFILLSVSVAPFIQKGNIQALNIVCVPASLWAWRGGGEKERNDLYPPCVFSFVGNIDQEEYFLTCCPMAFHSGDKVQTGLQIRIGSRQPGLCWMTCPLHMAVADWIRGGYLTQTEPILFSLSWQHRSEIQR